MANSDRLYKDKQGRMFMAMNMEGGAWNEHFITTTKLMVMAGELAITIFLVSWLNDRGASTGSYILFMGSWTVAVFYMTRYIIFEEKFYYRMYKELKKSEITTPSKFWSIVSTKETEDGVILTYADGKVGVIIKPESDTITGKPEDFIEEHYDAFSDLYKEIMVKRYSFIHMNIMEKTGKDPRMSYLDNLTTNSDNPNINKLMELQVGHLKNKTRKTLYESDCLLLYTYDAYKIDTIIEDAIDCINHLLDGAFVNYKILDRQDINDLVKESFGVKSFNMTEASLEVFNNMGITMEQPFKIVGVEYQDGQKQKVKDRERKIIDGWARRIEDGELKVEDLTVCKTLYVKDNKSEDIDFNTLSDVDIEVKKTYGKIVEEDNIEDFMFNSDFKAQEEIGNIVEGLNNEEGNAEGKRDIVEDSNTKKDTDNVQKADEEDEIIEL